MAWWAMVEEEEIHYKVFKGVDQKGILTTFLYWSRLENLASFEKNLYVELLDITSMIEDEVREYCNRHKIIVNEQDVPNSVTSFDDTGFPSIINSFFSSSCPISHSLPYLVHSLSHMMGIPCYVEKSHIYHFSYFHPLQKCN